MMAFEVRPVQPLEAPVQGFNELDGLLIHGDRSGKAA